MYLKPRKPRRAPPSHLEFLPDLLSEAEARLQAQGTARDRAERWLSPARILTPCCFPRAEDYQIEAVKIIETELAARGWGWRWDGDELVLDLPGWTPPAPRIFAVQPGLFD